MHGQPTNRLAGLTTAIDATRGIAPDIDAEGNHKREVLDPDHATEVVEELVDRAGLATARTTTDLELDVRTDARVTEGVRFDGKERMRFAVKTDSSPRHDQRAPRQRSPSRPVGHVHRRRPTDPAVRGELGCARLVRRVTLIDKDEAIVDLVSTRPERYDKRSPIEVISATLGYWAGEYAGGADLLEPSWFVEIEHRLDAKGGIPPRKLVRLPATRR